MSPWKIIDTVTGKQIGLIKKQRGTPAFEMIAVGEFGLYTIHVKFGYSGIIVEKDGFLVNIFLYVHENKFLTLSFPF